MKEEDSSPSGPVAGEAFRELADAAPAILWETDAEGRCTFISKGWTDLTGQGSEESLGLGWLDAVHPEDRDAARDTFLGANDQGAPFQLEYRLRSVAGGYRWATASARPRFDEGGRFIGFAGSTVDVDALKRVENELLASETRMRFAAEVAQVGTFEWNIQSNVNVWSPELEKIYGLAPGSFEGTYEAWRSLVHPDDREMAAFNVENALATDGFGAEWRIVRADGEIRWIEARARILRDAAGRPERMIGANLDVTERKRAEEALRDEARRKDEFLAVLAHELRNPLAPIRNAASILARVGPGEPAVFEKTTKMIERQVAHLARLTDDLLDVSRIALGKVRIEKERTDLRRLLRETLDDYRPYLESSSGLDLVIRIPEQPVFIDGDRVRISQAIGNLLHNAGKFTDPGGTVSVCLSVDRDGAVVTVRDSGVGIHPDLLDRLFEPFTQEDHADRNPGGLGLGLALVKGLAELHGGSASGSSPGSGQGSEFTIRLPAAVAPDSDAETGGRTDEDGSKLSIVLVEDYADAAESLTMFLELHGHTVHVAADGAAGFDLACGIDPDVILCDIGLPGEIDGFGVARAVRAHPGLKDVRLIALTGYGQARDRERTAEAGFDAHLLKPVDLQLLLGVLQDCVRSPRPSRAPADPGRDRPAKKGG